jgi:glycine dehydrogenase subunit 2
LPDDALMVEPTETESKETLDEAADAYLAVFRAARENPSEAHLAPHKAVIGRPDEVNAARNPVIRYKG